MCIRDSQWLSTEGVFGVALGVSSGFVFLFVLFGALLDTGGAGNYFIKSALSFLGHLRGGPAMAAVVSSGLTCMISGSSIANVVTVETFTIPLMKRVGYKPHIAAAVSTAASVDGQIMPPVMGAAAFLMVEYVGIPYTPVSYTHLDVYKRQVLTPLFRGARRRSGFVLRWAFCPVLRYPVKCFAGCQSRW